MSENNAGSLFDYLLSASTLPLPRAQEAEDAVQGILLSLSNPARQGGVTYSLYFGDQWGQPLYAVGLNNDWTEVADATQLGYALLNFMREHQEWLSNPRCCIGVWRGNVAGNLLAILDVSILVYHEEVAYRFGKESNQISIFPCKKAGKSRQREPENLPARVCAVWNRKTA